MSNSLSKPRALLQAAAILSATVISAFAAPACSTTTTSEPAAAATVDAGATATPPTTIAIQLKGVAKTHDDPANSQTPRDLTLGVVSLVLEKTENDPEPLVLFADDTFTEATLNDGDVTVLATVPVENLHAGTYTRAKLVVSHMRYWVKATFHATGVVAPGEFERLLVFADGFTVDGKKRKTGENRSTFIGEADGKNFGTHEGVAAVPALASTPIPLEATDERAAFVIATNLEIPEAFAGPTNLVIEADTKNCFGWKDETQESYKTGTWDIREETFEGVRQISPNGYELRFDAAATE